MKILEDVNILSTALRLFLALLCGGLLGLERGKKKRPAGFRTHMLVCVGAALAMITNIYMLQYYPGMDAARMGAQVISGIGFLGAGTIVVTGLQRIRGLTTAAGLWVVACIGLAFGTGFYSGGIIATVLCIIINTMLHTVESRMSSTNRVLSVFVELTDVSYVGRLLNFIRKKDIRIIEVETGNARTDDQHVGILLTIKISRETEHTQAVAILSECEGVCYAEEI